MFKFSVPMEVAVVFLALMLWLAFSMPIFLSGCAYGPTEQHLLNACLPNAH